MIQATEVKLRDTITAIVIALIEHPEKFQLFINQTQAGVLMVDIECHDLDKGKIIGRGGEMVKAIRLIARSIATKNNVRVYVELASQKENR